MQVLNHSSYLWAHFRRQEVRCKTTRNLIIFPAGLVKSARFLWADSAETWQFARNINRFLAQNFGYLRAMMPVEKWLPMAEVMRETQREFWRPPVVQQPLPSSKENAMAAMEACASCGTEFVVGSRYCYVCGVARQSQAYAPVSRHWIRYFEFHTIKQAIALSTASLIAFLIGVGCVFAAIAVGFIYAAQNFSDFQAIQLWRMEWLLAAVAAFVAGLLLKRTDTPSK